jgi:hypothetical protein
MVNGGHGGRRKKNFHNKKYVKRLEEIFKNQLLFIRLVSIRARGNEKQNPINAPSIQNGALVGAGLL